MMTFFSGHERGKPPGASLSGVQSLYSPPTAMTWRYFLKYAHRHGCQGNIEEAERVLEIIIESHLRIHSGVSERYIHDAVHTIMTQIVQRIEELLKYKNKQLFTVIDCIIAAYEPQVRCENPISDGTVERNRSGDIDPNR